MANTVFSHEDLVVKEAEGGMLFGSTFVPAAKLEQLHKQLGNRRGRSQVDAGTDAADPVVLPPEGGPPSGGDPRAYPDPIRRAVEGDELAVNQSERKGPSVARPAVDHMPQAHGPKDEQLAVNRAKTQAARDAADDKHKGKK